LKDSAFLIRRLLSVSDGTNSAGYSYIANSALVGQISFTNNGTLQMTTSNTFDNLNRRLTITNLPVGSSAIGFAYAYNAANQRTAVTNTDSTRWVYSYDSLGQVISGKKYWSNGSLVAGQQFEYTFDDIGNRKTTSEGGDNDGANLRGANYHANSLNQYTNRDVPGYVNVIGTANSNSIISSWTANGAYGTATRKGVKGSPIRAGVNR
jgi:YD repeat-containing protein